MRTIIHSFGTNLDWAKSFATALGGKFENNFIITKEKNGLTETRYVLDCEDGIIAYFVDVTYNRNFRFVNKNKTNDFIALYYNLTEDEGALFKADKIYQVGRWKCNFGIIDSNINTEYKVKAKTSTFLLAIFINRETILSFAKENNIPLQNIHKITNSGKTTISKFDRISNESHNIINDLRKLKVGGPVFDLNLKGSVHLLLCNFFKKISDNTMMPQNVSEYDLSSIITSQIFLMEHIEDYFPSIKLMAGKANMSESKFLILFKKITGLTPNSFFIENKLYRSKELIEEQQLSIGEVSSKLKFSNHSYFTSAFKKHFGLLPKTFAKQL